MKRTTVSERYRREISTVSRAVQVSADIYGVFMRKPTVVSATGGTAGFLLLPVEVQQVLDEAILVGIGQAMGRAGVDDQLRGLDLCGGGLAGDVERHDLVVIAMVHKGGHVELLQVLTEVGGRKRGEGIVGVLVAGLHALCPPAVDQAL